MDIVSKQVRSNMMSNIRGKNTRPEIIVRKKLFAAGYRFRIHVRKLPGNPDIVLPKFKTVIFIHGCFWHYHDCELFRMPQTQTDFWKQKLEGNRFRDRINVRKLLNLGWKVLSVYECAWRYKGSNEEKEWERITSKMIRFINGSRYSQKVIRGQKKNTL